MSDERAAEEAAPAPEPERAYGALVTWSHGQQVLHLGLDDYLAVARAITDDGFHMLVDLTAVDYLRAEHHGVPEGVATHRFELVVGFLSHRTKRRVRLRVQLPGESPLVPSLFSLHPGTEALEREVFDMFGIRFEGHPDLTRILMPEDWIGFPLRKDYEVGAIPVQFKGAPSSR